MYIALDELLRAIGLGLVDEALGVVGVERDVVVDPVPLDEVLVAGGRVADAAEAGGLGDPVVAPLGEATRVTAIRFSAAACCSGVTPGVPLRSIGWVGS